MTDFESQEVQALAYLTPLVTEPIGQVFLDFNKVMVDKALKSAESTEILGLHWSLFSEQSKAGFADIDNAQLQCPDNE